MHPAPHLVHSKFKIFLLEISPQLLFDKKERDTTPNTDTQLCDTANHIPVRHSSPSQPYLGNSRGEEHVSILESLIPCLRNQNDVFNSPAQSSHWSVLCPLPFNAFKTGIPVLCKMLSPRAHAPLKCRTVHLDNVAIRAKMWRCTV